MLTHASLFSGIGGFDLAAEWAGWENIFHCEWNPFGQKVLAHHFPNSKSYHDITKTDFSIHKGRIDVLTGGFPCQPYSSAGKRLGKADERHLFPHMLRAVKEIKPKWIIGENVRGLVSWNDGLVFNEVYADLESEGYEVQPFLIPAAGVNAPHQRYRIWFIAYNDAYSNSNGLHQFNSEYEIITGERRINAFGDINESNGNGDATDTNCNGQQQEWGYDRSSQNADGSNSKKFRTTDSENINGCNTHGNTERQCGIDTGTGIKGIYEKNETTNTNGVCGMDKNNRESKRNIRENKSQTDKIRTLVQDRQGGIQLSNNRGLGNIETTLSSATGFGQQNDISGINRLERDATDTDYIMSECRYSSAEKGWEKQSIRIESFSQPTKWKEFPTVSPICNGDDGLSNRLDNITFSKWRKESIKAGGNAIVPQVAYQIFKTINEFELLVNK